ncbi:MAG: YegP family protein [Thiotrichales bacterium]
MKAVLKKSDAAEPFSFVFEDGGKTLLRSENYKEKRSATNGIESVQKNCGSDGRYEMKESSNGKFYFNLKASNGQIIGTSPMFASDADRASAIAALKTASSAPVEDRTG